MTGSSRFLIPSIGLVAERYRHSITGRGATLRYWITPRGRHAVEGGPVGTDTSFRTVQEARAYWRTLRGLLKSKGFVRAGK